MENKNKVYSIPVSYEVYGRVEVEAKDKKDLMEKLKDYQFVSDMPLPDHPEYVDGSYEVDLYIVDEEIED